MLIDSVKFYSNKSLIQSKISFNFSSKLRTRTSITAFSLQNIQLQTLEIVTKFREYLSGQELGNNEIELRISIS